MSITDPTVTTFEDQPSEHTRAEHPSHPVDASPPTNPGRAVLRWFGGGIVAAAAAGAVSVLVIAADTDTSVNDVVVPESSDDNVITELDVRGVPTWWSHPGGTPRHDATELDVHGIPTWWSGSAPAR